jgi:hypothetical protein
LCSCSLEAANEAILKSMGLDPSEVLSDLDSDSDIEEKSATQEGEDAAGDQEDMEEEEEIDQDDMDEEDMDDEFQTFDGEDDEFMVLASNIVSVTSLTLLKDDEYLGSGEAQMLEGMDDSDGEEVFLSAPYCF